jgi:PAS domain S-box-containing protein
MEPDNRLSSPSHDLFRQAIEAAPNAMVVADSDGLIVLINAQTEKLFGYQRDELIGERIDILVPTRFRDAHPDFRQLFYDSPRSRPMGTGRDLFALRKDGSEVLVEIGLNPVRTSDQNFVLAAIVDLTERKRAERELLRSSRAELQRLSVRTEQTREEEKTRIARELHDDFGQQLVALKIACAKLENLVRSSGSDESITDLDMVYRLIDQLFISVRRIATDLRPTMLDDLGLIPALEWLVSQFSERHGVHVSHQICGNIDFNEDSATAVFRIVQEALTNVVRHAQATHVTLDIRRDGHQCVVRISDNGRGSATDHRGGPYSFGLLGIRERAAALQGHIQIETAPECGFALSVLFPVDVIEATGRGDHID